MESEIHLFIIWETGQNKRYEIIKDIRQHFVIMHIENVQWSRDNFSENLSRFYLSKSEPGSRKERECGYGPFTIVIVRDLSPIYEERNTLRGPAIVNARVFDAKVRYRKLTGGGYKVHATDNTKEARKDILLCTSKTYDYYAGQMEEWTAKIPENIIARNVIGCIQWNSLEELVTVLNETIDYVILRSFDRLFSDIAEGKFRDIDILVSNLQQAILVCNARPTIDQYHTDYLVNVNNLTLRFDFCYIGDGYFDSQWEEAILTTRQKLNNIYVPSPNHHRFSLLYHALIHKKTISDNRNHKLSSLGFNPECYRDTLNRFMNEHGYQYSDPLDASVYFNITNAGCNLSWRRKYKPMLFKIKKNISQLGARTKKNISRYIAKTYAKSAKIRKSDR